MPFATYLSNQAKDAAHLLISSDPKKMVGVPKQPQTSLNSLCREQCQSK